MPLLGYWNIRGLAQPIRLLLAYAEEEYDEKRYDFGPAPDFNTDSWMKEKFELGMEYPNLPYYFDGDFKISQSNAILRYIARKYKLDGSNEKEKVLVDILTDEAMDFRLAFSQLCYNSDYEKLRAGYLENVKPKLERFEKNLANKDFFAGNNITYVDFIMYEALNQHSIFEPALLKDTPNINTFLAKIENLPAIQKYMSSAKFLKEPINAPMAGFI